LQYQRNLYIAEKYIQWATILSQTFNYGSILIHLTFVAYQIREIPIKFDFIAVHGHRSWCQSKAHMRLAISH